MVTAVKTPINAFFWALGNLTQQTFNALNQKIMSTKNTNIKDLKEILTAFNKDVDGVTLPLPVHDYLQTAIKEQSFIKLSCTVLVTMEVMASPDNCSYLDVQNTLGLAYDILDRLSYDMEVLDKL